MGDSISSSSSGRAVKLILRFSSADEAAQERTTTTGAAAGHAATGEEAEPPRGGANGTSPPGGAGGAPTSSLEPWRRRDWGHAYWPNGWRKDASDATPDVLCFETGHYGLTFDIRNMTKVGFGTFGEADHVPYVEAVDMDSRSRMDRLGEEELRIEATVDGRTYRAATTAGVPSQARLWEAGQIAQNYELMGLKFKDGDGRPLACGANLRVVAWPGSFSLTLSLSPAEGAAWGRGASVRMELGQWSVEKAFGGPWDGKTEHSVSLVCNVNGEAAVRDGIGLRLSGYKLPNIGVSYDPVYNCYVANITDPPRTFAGGFTRIVDYDKYHLTVQNDTEEGAYVPFMMHLQGQGGTANITGVVPMVCHADGTPTGIPIQISKDWHHVKWFKPYSLLPAPANSTLTYVIQFVYGFYGSIPSASHANLSLVGWGNDKSNGRWDQMAVGCWGETFCLNVELSACDVLICDVRGLFLRRGKDGPMWSWSTGAWGGEWLYAFDGDGRRVRLRGVKAAYASQGPCLTQAHYGGYYGAAGGTQAAAFRHEVNTLRTDDYIRVFFRLDLSVRGGLRFDDALFSKGCALFRQGWGVSEPLRSPRLAVGNADGLIEEYSTAGAEVGTYLAERLTLTGPGPWWVAYPGMRLTEWKLGDGSRALIIRSYEVATPGGRTYSEPCVSLFVGGKEEGQDCPAIDALVVLPPGVDELGGGSAVSLDLYWATLPHDADDYYGPNEALRKHLEEKPDSWETAWREARGNDLAVEVAGGVLRRNYPVVVQASGGGAAEVRVDIKGGVGAIPIRFEGLDSPSYRLFRVMNDSDDGNECLVSADDSWQLNYEADTYTFVVTYNILLDGLETSSWVLQKCE